MFAVQVDGIGAEYITDDGVNVTPGFSLFVKQSPENKILYMKVGII